MAESVAADDGFIRLHRETGQLADQPAGVVNLRGIDTGGQVEEIAAGLDSHDDFFQRGIAGPLADAVDGAFHLPGAVFDGFQAVGHSQAQVVVAVDADHGLSDIGHVFEDALDQGPRILRAWHSRRYPGY